MARGSIVVSIALLVLSAMSVHCGVDRRPPDPGSSVIKGALVGNPDPAIVRLMVRANVTAAHQAEAHRLL